MNWFWRSRVSTILLIVSLEFLVAYFLTGRNYTGFLALPTLFIIVSIVERGKLMDAMNEHIHDEDLREFFKLPDPYYRKPLPTLFSRGVNTLILLGTCGILVVVFLHLIGAI